VFPEALIPALASHVHGATGAIDRLVATFVDAQAAAGHRLAKAAVKAKIKAISSTQLVGKTPRYTVHTDTLAAAGVAPTAAVAATDAPAAAAAAVGVVVGGKRLTPESQDNAGEGQSVLAATHASGAQQQQQQQDGSTAKKHKRTPAAGGIQHFFSSSSNSTQQMLLQQQQPHQATGSPPTTPRGQTACGTAPDAGCVGSGVLPMLTPPSDVAAERPGKASSPVPFNITQAGAGSDDEETEAQQPAGLTVTGSQGSAGAQQGRVNRWHEQADCRGLSLQGGNADSMQLDAAPPVEQPGAAQMQLQQEPQQQQLQLPQQQQSQLPLPLPSSKSQPQAHPEPACCAAPVAPPSSPQPGSSGGGRACSGGAVAAAREPPHLPDDGSPPGEAFWRQLVRCYFNRCHHLPVSPLHCAVALAGVAQGVAASTAAHKRPLH
jgi:hypothetical protein